MTRFWPGTLARLVAGEDLSSDEAAEAMRRIMSEDASPAQIAAFAVALRTKGETPEEIAGLAATMLEMAPPVTVPGPVVDTCGTGGDRAGTLNVSTIAAVVAAGAGAVVAKHGNRAASSQCGSADLLEALGVKIDLGPEGVSRCLSECGIGFMFAPVFHAAMAHAAGPRREMGIPTVFNFLGPLTNPARPSAQIVGVSDARMLPKLARVLAERGSRAMCFRGADGLDELTTTGPSALFDVRSGRVEEQAFDPAKVGIPIASPEALSGGDPQRNAGITRAVLDGEKGAPRDIVLLGAAAALTVAGLADSVEAGLARAAESVDSGKARETLERWVELSNRAG